MEQEIIKRLKEILEYLKLSPSKLADEISINRSRLSHILNGRNNPTLEVIQGILVKYNEINPDWLLFGQGIMIRAGIEPAPKDLFQYAEINKKKKQAVTLQVKSESADTEDSESESESTKIESINKEKAAGKTSQGTNKLIKRITVYYSDNEYQDFMSEG